MITEMELAITRPQLEEEEKFNVFDVAYHVNSLTHRGDLRRDKFYKSQRVEPREIKISEVTLQRLNLIAELHAKFALLQESLIEDSANTDEMDKAFNAFNRAMWDTINTESAKMFFFSEYKEI